VRGLAGGPSTGDDESGVSLKQRVKPLAFYLHFQAHCGQDHITQVTGMAGNQQFDPAGFRQEPLHP